MAETTIRSLRPDRIAYANWRVGKVTAVNTPTATVRVLIASGFVRNKTVATSILPNGVAVGHPLAVEISSSHPDSSTVLQVTGTHWGGNGPRDEASAATNDGAWPVLPRSITNEPLTWWEE